MAGALRQRRPGQNLIAANSGLSLSPVTRGQERMDANGVLALS
ncbi:hypothetical protein FB99_00860 [Pantoea agglomerans]|nr:hypothetical protein FB99_00860 [Pantoea agglomerans]